MRKWMLDDIKNSLNLRDKDGKANYTHVVGMLFRNEIEYLKTINIDVKRLMTGYNLVAFKDNIENEKEKKE